MTKDTIHIEIHSELIEKGNNHTGVINFKTS